MVDWEMANHSSEPTVAQFKESKRVGKVWEWRVKRFLKRLPETVRVDDVSENPGYQKWDIDLLWWCRAPNGTLPPARTVDVKTARTRHLYLQTVHNVDTGAPGKFLASKADFWFVVFPKEITLCVIPLPAARAWFEAHGGRYKRVRRPTGSRRGYVFYTSEAAVVPRADLLRGVPAAFEEKNFYTPDWLDALWSGLMWVKHRWEDTREYIRRDY